MGGAEMAGNTDSVKLEVLSHAEMKKLNKDEIKFRMFVWAAHSKVSVINNLTNICIHSWNNLAKIVDKPSALLKNELKKECLITLFLTID